MIREPLLSLKEAQDRLLALVRPLPLQHLDAENALGHYLAEPVLARRTQPAASLSAMDGYAVHSNDMTGPWQVIGESAAGHPFNGHFAIGEAVRISTGAILPQCAGAVILQEDVARSQSVITLTGEAPFPPDKHIRPKGMDFNDGDPVLTAGTLIGPGQLALALNAGHRHLAVRKAPRVLVMDSGDELAANPEDCAQHQIPASNGAMLAGMARSLPCVVRRIGPVPDSLDDLAEAFLQADEADVIVTSGGASVGDHDFIKPALEAWGATLSFWRVAIRPGKPILVATRMHEGRHQIILGLPGNPVSSFVTAYLFMLPLLRSMAGGAKPLPVSFPARLQKALPANGSRQTFVRAVWDAGEVTPYPNQDSSALSSLATSNVLIDRAANAQFAEVGDTVNVYWIGNGGIA